MVGTVVAFWKTNNVRHRAPERRPLLRLDPISTPQDDPKVRRRAVSDTRPARPGPQRRAAGAMRDVSPALAAALWRGSRPLDLERPVDPAPERALLLLCSVGVPLL